ncbi:MAG: AI-2E family transporter [Nanoarchaeota archaeon]
MKESDIKNLTIGAIFAVLFVALFFLVKPILLSVITGVLLAFIFTPAYKKLCSLIKSRSLSATIISGFLFLIILLPMWFFTPILIKQSFKIYKASQQLDIITALKGIFPNLFASQEFSNEVGNIISSFISQLANASSNFFSNIILNFPTIFLHIVVIAFTFFFTLRDQEELILYLKSIMPFSREVEKKFFEYTKGITASVIYGQVIVGIMQGLIVGIGFALMKVPNALLLTLLACLAGIFPVIGTTIIWFPTALFLLIGGNTFSAIGLTFFGLISTLGDNVVRPLIVSKRTQMHSALILIGMIGGLFLFGILGFILGPLIIAYLLIILELYRKKKAPSILLEFDQEEIK